MPNSTDIRQINLTAEDFGNGIQSTELFAAELKRETFGAGVEIESVGVLSPWACVVKLRGPTTPDDVDVVQAAALVHSGAKLWPWGESKYSSKTALQFDPASPDAGLISHYGKPAMIEKLRRLGLLTAEQDTGGEAIAACLAAGLLEALPVGGASGGDGYELEVFSASLGPVRSGPVLITCSAQVALNSDGGEDIGQARFVARLNGVDVFGQSVGDYCARTAPRSFADQLQVMADVGDVVTVALLLGTTAGGQTNNAGDPVAVKLLRASAQIMPGV